jgi:hypothetical protein
MTRLNEGGFRCAYASKSSFTSSHGSYEGVTSMRKIESVLATVLFAIVSSGGNGKIH